MNGVEVVTNKLVRTQKKKIGVAIFGVGRNGRIHATSLVNSPRVDLRWIVEEDFDRAYKFMDEMYLNDTRVVSFRDVQNVWNDDSTEAIVVCTPTPTHVDVILKGLRAGGMYHDCGVHDIDVICWILDEDPITIFAQGHAFHPEIEAMNDVDQVAIVMKFPSGVIATIDFNRDTAYGYDQRLEVFGSKGMLQRENILPAPVSAHKKSGAIHVPILPTFIERYSESFVNEMDHFLDVVEGKINTVDVSMDETLRAAWIAELCKKSEVEGKLIKYTPPPF